LTIEPNLRLVTARAEGALSTEDIKTYLESIAAEGGMPLAKLFDISEADAALTAADLQALGRSIRQYASARMAGRVAAELSPAPLLHATGPCDTSRRFTPRPCCATLSVPSTLKGGDPVTSTNATPTSFAAIATGIVPALAARCL
jgi:hypothetical protein